MTRLQDIPKNLPYWKYAQYGCEIPYWQYRLGEDADLNRFIVFKGKDGLKRSWFITDYVIPCDPSGKKFYTAKEVADPAIKPTLALVVVRQEQGQEHEVLIGLVLDHDFNHPDPELVAANDIGLQENMVQPYHSMRNYGAVERFTRMIKLKYSKYLEATERMLMQ